MSSTPERAKKYIQELLQRRNYTDFLSDNMPAKNAFDVVLDQAVKHVEQMDGNLELSVVDFLSNVYEDARERLLALEQNVLDIQAARIYLEGDFQPFVKEEVVRREAQLSTGESHR